MGKRGGKKRDSDPGAASSSLLHTSLTLREEASGRKQTHNPKSLLKLKHLQNIAEWAAGEASVPSLGAFLGCRFAEFGETLGIRPDPSFFPCQRCETLLQPGYNCSVRIEKNRSKRRHRRGKTHPPAQNNVVYTCNFCSHRNLRRGTPKGHMREICPPKTNFFPSKLKARNPTLERSDEAAEKSNTNKVEDIKVVETPSPCLTSNIIGSSTMNNQATSGVKLLDSKRSKRKKLKGFTDQTQVGSAPVESRNTSGTSTSKNTRTSQTSLKEISEGAEAERNQRFKKLPIPFRL